MSKYSKLILGLIVFSLVSAGLYIHLTKKAETSTLSSSSVTLSNSRLSFKAAVAAGTAGSSLVTITSGSSDPNTNHLFPGDVLCFTDAGQNGCIGSTTYTVANIVDSTHFNLTAPLANNLDTSGYAVASQSGTWTIAFTTASQIPVGGSIVITIPMADNAKGNDGIPDNGSSTATSGFDLNKLVSGNVSITGCTPANWGSATITAGSGSSDHTISFTRSTSSCPASTPITITLGGNGLVNPGAITSGHTQGTADVYGITINTKDGSGNILDSSTPRVAPVEAVLISATVDESLSFVVTGTNSGTTHCGNTTSITTTPTSIPWGHFAASNTFYYAAQNLAVNTNASGGYVVTIQESDQMGRNGNVCTGTAPSSGNFTFGSATCIRDTTCSSATPCSESVMGDWTDPANFVGLGYSEATTGGTTAATFYYNQGGRTFNAKQLADTQGGETPAAIMSASAPVSGDAIDVCYKISIPGNQPSGYYYNSARYTATATF